MAKRWTSVELSILNDIYMGTDDFKKAIELASQKTNRSYNACYRKYMKMKEANAFTSVAKTKPSLWKRLINWFKN